MHGKIATTYTWEGSHGIQASLKNQAKEFCKRYVTPSDPTLHEVYHCCMCPTQFTSFSNLITHEHTKHDMHTKPVTCKLCQRDFAHSAGFIQHAKSSKNCKANFQIAYLISIKFRKPSKAVCAKDQAKSQQKVQPSLDAAYLRLRYSPTTHGATVDASISEVSECEVSEVECSEGWEGDGESEGDTEGQVIQSPATRSVQRVPRTEYGAAPSPLNRPVSVPVKKKGTPPAGSAWARPTVTPVPDTQAAPGYTRPDKKVPPPSRLFPQTPNAERPLPTPQRERVEQESGDETVTLSLAEYTLLCAQAKRGREAEAETKPKPGAKCAPPPPGGSVSTPYDFVIESTRLPSMSAAHEVKRAQAMYANLPLPISDQVEWVHTDHACRMFIDLCYDKREEVTRGYDHYLKHESPREALDLTIEWAEGEGLKKTKISDSYKKRNKKAKKTPKVSAK
ncbi:hypothetical protein KIPB_010993 [Kipferlia bialata]|uniref:C2H2-type domain-containing protein n=1 Tax=Kipferlia bialata TaxID=797122 RepID=A0A9K3D5D1_9EUKA|nr:hypothetical protein KIPB_010993 [Kipferlia bialata]|eukprot:g10993.t1